MEMSEIYNGSQWAHDIFLVNKAGATESRVDPSPCLLCNIMVTIVTGYHTTMILKNIIKIMSMSQYDILIIPSVDR